MGFVGGAAPEDDHGGDGVGAAEVRNVEAFEAFDGLFEFEDLLEGLGVFDGEFALFFPAWAAAVGEDFGVFEAHVEEAVFGADFGDLEVVFWQFAGVDFVGNEDFFGYVGGELVVLFEEGAEDFLGFTFVFFEFVGFEGEVEGFGEDAGADLEEVEVGGALDDGVVDDVGVFLAGGGDFLFLEDGVDFFQFVAGAGGFFKFFRVCLGVHFAGEVFDDFVGAPFEEIDGVFDDFSVLFLGAFCDAGCDAAFYVVVEAGIFENFVGDFEVFVDV